jgi:hypothetical protein
MKQAARKNPLEELFAIERATGQRLDEPESTMAIAALRSAGVLGDEDWKQIRKWFRDALAVCARNATAEPRYNEWGMQIIDGDSDPRNADWMRICNAWGAIGYRMPHWATLWVWWLGYERPKAFWRRVARAAEPWRMAEDGDGEG